MQRAKQAGFTALETILVIVVVALVAGTSYYVYHQQNKESVPAAKQSTVTSSKTDAQKYLTISEWKVKLPLASDLVGSASKVKTSDGQQSADIIVPNSECSPMATIVRGSANDDDPTTNPDGEGTSQTFKESPNSKHVGDYYYSLIEGNGTICFEGESTSDSSSAQSTKTTTVRQEIETAFKSISASS